MSKLYPPTIEGKLPAQAGDTLSIPFIINRAINKDEIKGMSCIIKTLQNNNKIISIEDGNIRFDGLKNLYYANFKLPLENKLKVG